MRKRAHLSKGKCPTTLLFRVIVLDAGLDNGGVHSLGHQLQIENALASRIVRFPLHTVPVGEVAVIHKPLFLESLNGGIDLDFIVL